MAVNNFDKEKVSNFCLNLKKAVLKRKEIPDTALLDFTRIACSIIHNDSKDNLPDSFFDLKNAINDYVLYCMRNGDLNFSYIRLFQTVQMISVYLKEIEHNQRIDSSIEKNKENFKLMELIYNYPGVTIKDIFEYFKDSITNTDCLNRLSEMENGGILLTRKIGASKYYELSKFGLDLFKNLRGD